VGTFEIVIGLILLGATIFSIFFVRRFNKYTDEFDEFIKEYHDDF